MLQLKLEAFCPGIQLPGAICPGGKLPGWKIAQGPSARVPDLEVHMIRTRSGKGMVKKNPKISRPKKAQWQPNFNHKIIMLFKTMCSENLKDTYTLCSNNFDLEKWVKYIWSNQIIQPTKRQLYQEGLHWRNSYCSSHVYLTFLLWPLKIR